MSNKLFILKKMIGKKIVVIEDLAKFITWFGIVESVKDEETLVVKNENEESFNVSIFNIRNPYQDII
jgi:ferredoxin-fold anticodon binding domain-containing protein